MKIEKLKNIELFSWGILARGLLVDLIVFAGEWHIEDPHIEKYWTYENGIIIPESENETYTGEIFPPSRVMYMQDGHTYNKLFKNIFWAPYSSNEDYEKITLFFDGHNVIMTSKDKISAINIDISGFARVGDSAMLGLKSKDKDKYGYEKWLLIALKNCEFVTYDLDNDYIMETLQDKLCDECPYLGGRDTLVSKDVINYKNHMILVGAVDFREPDHEKYGPISVIYDLDNDNIIPVRMIYEDMIKNLHNYL